MHSAFGGRFERHTHESRRKEITDFSQGLHHRSNAFKRRDNGVRYQY